MVLKDEIDIDLWEVIQKNYESDNFTGAILDAIFKLTDTILLASGDRDHILSGVFNQFLSEKSEPAE